MDGYVIRMLHPDIGLDWGRRAGTRADPIYSKHFTTDITPYLDLDMVFEE